MYPLNLKRKSHLPVYYLVCILRDFFSVRLWGDHGQEALEGAKICLINASATGTEILKNLILPGSVVLSQIFI